jgi:histidinol-phosphate aminotransferase
VLESECCRRLEQCALTHTHSDYKDDGTNILLDANENAYGPGLALQQNGTQRKVNGSTPEAAVDFLGLNRYPDPHQEDLKRLFCQLRNTYTHTDKQLRPENLFCGVGSDEAIDALLRCFCAPGKEKILTCPPTYGMYAVSADVNDIQIVHVPLDAENGFSLRTKEVMDKLSADALIKMVYICSPGNPTASMIRKQDIRQILEHPTWNGIVIVDEAYIDFSPEGSSLAEWVLEWPNLVVMQTLSKAFGLAGIRLGVAFSSSEVAALLNNMKAPYNISSPTSAIAIAALQQENLDIMRENRKKILVQRERLLKELPRIPGVGRFRGGTDSNFLLVEILDRPQAEGGCPDNPTALTVYETLAGKRGVVVRFRGKEVGCTGCLRITVGTEKEVDRFLDELKSVLQQIYTSSSQTLKVNGEKEREVEANAVIS